MAIVGIDVGTQSLKAVVVGDDLAVLGADSRAYTVDHPRPGWAQQDPLAWEEALAPAVRGALTRARLSPSAVTGVGVAGQLDGCIAVGDDGVARGPCLIWMDRRAAREVPTLPPDFRERTGLTADPSHMAAKIVWLRHHAHGLAGARFHQPVSYLVERLCGEFVMDHGLASTTMLYGLAARDFDDELLACFGVERAALPLLGEASDAAGSLTAAGSALLGGLPVGIPVAVGTGDDFATPLGAGVVAPGVISCVIGTAEVVGGLCERPVIDPSGLVETHGYAVPGFFVENPGWLSGGAVAWLREIIGATDDEELDRWADAVPPGAGGVTFLPALSGAMAPAWVASARGCFYGMTAGHGRGHLARALLEASAFAMRDVIDRLDELGVPTGSILLVGGGARSRTWNQIRADVLGRPVELAAVEDSCPLGAAVLAAVAAGHAPDPATAAAALAGERAVVEPDLARRAACGEAYDRYRDLFDALRPLFERDADR
ncbi:MAG TPA: FGGY family carbohydrate kinase [Kofleriaceae bacterium]|nr:FGGY family carbohydrate kinase [Kofleriaceae bacterium]